MRGLEQVKCVSQGRVVNERAESRRARSPLGDTSDTATAACRSMVKVYIIIVFHLYN